LKHPEDNKSLQTTEQRIVTYRDYTLDPFQVEAIDELMAGHSVLVSAPTGVGKTLIADYLIDQVIKRNDQVIYTAPIKALSNQKYKEFKALYGEERVGIITGDVVINPEAPVTLMTTEIFRNILHQDPKRVEGITHIIFDEIHYLSDEDRGTVWEESIIFMPPGMRLLGLSATIPNAEELAAWISEIKGHEVAVIRKFKRSVPLKHALYEKSKGAVSKEELVEYRRELMAKSEQNGGMPRFKETRHYDLIRYISKFGLPCLYFVFSRRGCEEMAYELMQSSNFLTANERNQVETVVDQMAKEYGIENLRSLVRLRQLLVKGIGYHHAGILPAQKEIIETLFGMGLVKVMYATETFAVGINYPVKTVCFDSPAKWDGVSFRKMTTMEYFQMAGRAGRRGIDREGRVFILADLSRFRSEDFPSTNERDIEELVSQFNLSYNSVLNLYRNYDEDDIRIILDRNFATYQARTVKMQLEKELLEKEAELPPIVARMCEARDSLGCPLVYYREKEKWRKKTRRNRTRASGPDLAVAERLQEQGDQLMEAVRKNCPRERQKTCKKVVRRYRTLTEKIAVLRRSVNHIKTAGRFEEDLALKRAVLEQLGYIEGTDLLPRGLFASCIYAQELLVTELFFDGVFHEWSEDEINSMIVAVDYEPRKGESAPRDVPFDFDRVRKIIRRLHMYGVDDSDSRFHTSLSIQAFKWSCGCEFQELLRSEAGFQEGDIVAGFRRGIDLLRQIRAACEDNDPALAAKIRRCMDKMDRDLVEVTL
jgi:superfamily II RNA helicase